jgi:predicted alpha/beta-hydrolase family hydrolase
VIPAGQGEAHVIIDRPDGAPRFVLALTHGAGGGVEAPDLLAARDAAVSLGGAVARVVQPYVVRGARAPGSAARQDEAWVTVLAALRTDLREELGTGPLVQGGRSNGARLACRTAGPAGARAVIALAFPLHPPGRPERSRRDELRMAASSGADVLVVNGSRDPFGVPGPADAEADGRHGGGKVGGGAAGTARIVVLDGETHALSRDPGAVGAAVSGWLGNWLDQRGAPPR